MRESWNQCLRKLCSTHCISIVWIGFWLVGWLGPVSAQVTNEDFRSSADVFLRRLTSAEHQGMGGSFVGSISGANALNSNPAGLSFIDSNRLVTHVARFPRTVAIVARLNEVERYEDYGQYDLGVSGLEFLNYSLPLGARSVIGFDVAFGHEGKFSRVNDIGKATNSFPESDLAIGVGYSIRWLNGLSAGIDARWMRSKVQDDAGQSHLGHGYAYNLGVIQKLGKHLRVGGVIRNLSNGLSFSDDSIPDRIHRDVVIGAVYQLSHKEVDIQVGLDVNPPFEEGVRASLGTEIWYRGFVGGRIGYRRHTEERFDSVLVLESAQLESESRIWKADGFTLGLGARLGNITLNVAYTPQMKPTNTEEEQVRVEQGQSVYSFSIGQRF